MIMVWVNVRASLRLKDLHRHDYNNTTSAVVQHPQPHSCGWKISISLLLDWFTAKSFGVPPSCGLKPLFLFKHWTFTMGKWDLAAWLFSSSRIFFYYLMSILAKSEHKYCGANVWCWWKMAALVWVSHILNSILIPGNCIIRARW